MTPSRDISTTRLALFCLLSCLSHAVACYLLAGYGRFDFAPPVNLFQAITVDLKTDAEPAPAPTPHPVTARPADETAPSAPTDAPKPPPVTESKPADAPAAQAYQHAAAVAPGSETRPAIEPRIRQETVTSVQPRHVPAAPDKQLLPQPIRSNGEFVRTRKETLSYQVRLLGLPIGSAGMVATNKDGELRITTSVRSNAATSLIYPVDNTTETRIFSGRYIMTTIKQHEGTYRNDVGFTLCLGEKNVFWTDRLRNRYSNEPLPTDQTMDLISGFFFLRNQPLEVGKSIVLHLYDSNTYSPTEVTVLRKERLTLPGFKDVDTLVIQPLLQTDGMFRRTGDLFVWLTDDASRVPVKMETSVSPLGKVTVELVSAEVEQ